MPDTKQPNSKPASPQATNAPDWASLPNHDELRHDPVLALFADRLECCSCRWVSGRIRRP